LIEADDMAGRGAVFAWESHPYIRDRRRKLGSELGPAVASEATRNPDRYEEAIADLLLTAAQQELDARRPERARAAIERPLRHRPAGECPPPIAVSRPGLDVVVSSSATRPAWGFVEPLSTGARVQTDGAVTEQLHLSRAGVGALT